MGEKIVKKIRGMSWTAKISLMLIFTLVFSTFMYQGWYKPKPVHAAVAYRSSSTAETSADSGDISVTMPAGTVLNDIMIMVIVSNDNVVVTLPAGWTKFKELNNTTALRGTLAWKRAGAGEAGPYAVTHTAGSNITAAISSFSGCITTVSPIDVSSMRANASSITLTADAITTTVDNTMVILTGHVAGRRSISGQVATDPASFTEAFDFQYNGSVDNAISLAYASKSATGSTGVATATIQQAELNNGGLFALIPQPVAPTLTSPTATLITNTTATLGANITSNGGAALTARGTCWGTTPAPATNCVAEGGTAIGIFTQARTGLTAGTLLYYRGYATNSAGTGYSPDGSFYTEPTSQATAVTFSSVTSTTMTVGWTRGSPSPGDGVIVLMRSGAAVATDPTDGTYTGYTASSTFGSGTAIGSAYVIYKGTGTSVAVTGLTASTTYYVAVYEYKGTVDTSGVNQGTNYKPTPATGFQATINVPTLTLPTATLITNTTATLGATITSDGGAALTARGTCWGPTPAPAINCVAEGGTATGVFTQARTGLTAGTLLYYRGYATNSAGTGYSPDGSFYTEPTSQATAVTFSSVTSTTMTVGWTRGSPSPGDGVIVLMRSGAAVATDPTDGTYTTYTASSTFGSGTAIGSAYVIYKGTGTSVAVTGLTASTTYYVAVYEYKGTVDTSGVNQGTNYKTPAVTNSQATAAVVAPTVTSPTATSVLSTTATLGANVTADGGAALTANGTCWATTATPVINCVDQGSHITGVFTHGRTGLTEGSLLYYRGYATNSAGTGYSADGTIYTEPTQPNTLSFSGISSSGMTVNWLIGSTGNADNVIVVMRSGSAVNADPVDGTTYTANAAFGSGTEIGTGNYVVYKGTGTSVPVTALSPSTTYYVKVYAYAAGAGGTENYNVTSPLEGSQATSAAVCTRNQPTLNITPASQTITTDGGSKGYTLAITNNDTGSCANETFDLSKTDSNSTNFDASTLSQPSVNLAPGGNTNVTLTVNAKPGETSGSNDTYVTATSANHTPQQSNTVTTTINIVNPLLHNSVVTASTKWGSAWGIAGGKYGEFTCGTCHAPRATNIKGVKSTVTAPTSPAEDFPGGAGSSVNFQSFTTSATDMGNDSGNSPRASSTRICEVCHTYDVTQVSGVNAHPYSVGSLLTNHYSADNTDCTSCHKHNVGFKGMGCDSCHGNPPTDTSSGGPTGLANDPGPTGSTTAGAHLAHVTTLSFACGNCHYGYSMPESPKQIIDIGFSMWTKDGTGTTYGAANEVNAADDYRGTNGTTIVDDNTRKCSNLYCHGNFTGGLNAAPILTGTAVCGTCHANDVASAGSLNNSHPRHAGSGAGGISVACADCHNNGTAYILKNGHVNGKIAWSLKTGDSRFSASAKYNGAASGEINNVAPSASYQTCATLYCHSNVQNGTAGGGPTSYGTPTWGAASVSCSQGVTGCHGNAPATPTANNAHGTHTTGNYLFACSACHNNGGDESANHANGTLNMNIDTTSYGATAAYSQGDHTPGSGGYGTCSNTYCHGNFTGGLNASPAWGASIDCTTATCHNYTNATPPTKVNHPRHVGTGAGQLNLACNKCHPARASLDGHVDSNVQWDLDRTDTKIGSGATYRALELGSTGAKAPSGTYGICGSVYCHSSVQANPGNLPPASYATPTWGAASVTCDSCHGQGAGVNDGSPSTGSHPVHVATYAYTCAVCHTGHGDETATHANRTINLAFDAATAGGSAAYTGDTVPQSGAFGNCTTTFCHGDSSNTSAEVGNWGTSLSAADACTVCHGTKTTPAADGAAAVNNRAPGGNATGVDTNGNTAATDAQVGAHDTHLRFLNSYSEGTTAIPNMCNECHTIPAATVAGIKGHFLDGTPAELTWGTRATFNTATPSYASSICSGTYCHGAKMPAGSTGGSDTSPLWTDTAYLTGTPTLAGDCGKCHASPPATSSHTGSETIADCNACHPHVNVDGSFNDLTKHVDGIMQATGDCVGCHAGIKGTRRAVVGEFGLAWGHKKTGRGAVTPADCCVCHLEGNSTADPTPSGVHNNGVINLKNPDTGGALTTFASFTRNTASNSLEAAVTNVQNNLCLKCHDADGALSASARVSGGTATNPWNDGATMVNVDAHFTTTNASYHPVKGTQNNDYCDSVTMVAPWNGITKTKGTKTAGYQISCFDCHNAGAELASGSVTAHGNAVTLRATYNRSASAATALCIECHKTTVYSTGANSTGSAFYGTTNASHSNTGSKMVESNFGTGGCLICHSSLVNGPARPTRAQDAHGFPGGTYTSGAKQWSFLRETALFTNWQPKSGGGSGTPTCWINPTNDGNATCARNGDHDAGGGTAAIYTPGGAY